MIHDIPEMGTPEMSDAMNVHNGGMSRRVSEVGDLILEMAIVPDDAAVDFVGRLAKDQEWPRQRAQRAYDEYQRFLLMAWVGPTMIVPSHDVDQAWHLHLTHSRHYWEVLCGEILQKPFHHDPSNGGESEDGRHSRAYERTLALYRHLFGEEAPMDVWPRGCTCVDAHDETQVPNGTVLASSPLIPVILFGGVLTTLAWLLGHPWMTGSLVVLSIVFAIMAVGAERADREDRERIRTGGLHRSPSVTREPDDLSGPSYARPVRSTSYSTGRSSGRRDDAGAGGKTAASDSSGHDSSLAFLAIMASDDASASSQSTSHGHSSSSKQSSSSDHSSGHSSSSHSSHSCSSSSSSGHSCGSSSSCGGSSCGGGGCGGS